MAKIKTEKLSRKARKQAAKALKAEKKQIKKAKAQKRNHVTRKFGLLMMGAYVPAFINIHFRYARHNFKIWAALFVAPFLVVKLALIRLIELLPEQNQIVWHYDLLAIFAISVCFYAAERFDRFRRVYVWAVPFTIFFGLLYWSAGQGSQELAGNVVKFLLIAYLSYRVGKFTLKEGYVELDDGADTDYHTGKELYDAGHYPTAISLLEASAKRGHFKSLYMLGEAYEHGHHYTKDTVKAAACYYKASQKGYIPAKACYEALLNEMTLEQTGTMHALLQDTQFLKE